MEYTKTELDKLQKSNLTSLIQYAGGISHLSKMVSLPVTTIQGWVRRGRISKKAAVTISVKEAFSKKFTAEILRPDITDDEILEFTKIIIDNELA